MTAGRAKDAGANAFDLEFVAKATLIVITLWALANLLWLARDILFITFFALLVASFLSIFVEPLHERGVSRAIAAPLVLLILLLMLIGLSVLAWPTLREQIVIIQQQLPPAIDALEAWFRQQLTLITGSVGRDADDLEDQLRDSFDTGVTGLIGGALPLLNTAAGAISGFVLIVIAGLFIAISPRTYMHGLIVLFPKSRRKRMGEVLPKAGYAMTQWMKGTAIAMVLVGAMAVIGLSLIGVPAALALGVIAGLLEFIPYIGPVLGFVPAIVIALAVSPQAALWVLGLYAIVQFTESNLITPLLMKQMVKLPPALTLLFQTMFGLLFGFLGLLLAVPMLATGKILIEELYVEGVADEH